MKKYVLTVSGMLVLALLAIAIILAILMATRPLWAAERDTSSHDAQSGSSEESLRESDLPHPDKITFDLVEGTMTFLFTPDLQTELDDNTISIIGDLLTSPKNAEGSNIAVEIPQLPDGEIAIITDAVISAFVIHEVSISDITFLVYQPEPDARTFEINVSFR